MKSDTLAGIHKRSFNTPRPWSAKEIDQLLLRDSTHLITGKNSFLLGVLTDYEAEILTLAVDPINRRLGIAKDLLKKFENICLQKNIDKIVVKEQQIVLNKVVKNTNSHKLLPKNQIDLKKIQFLIDQSLT